MLATSTDNWGYRKIPPDSENLDSWAAANNLGLLYDPKGADSFSSHWWNVVTNQDLAFASVDQDNRLPDRCVLGKFQPSHIATEAQSSCLQQSSEALKLSKGWLETIFLSHRWICWEIATSGHNKHWEGRSIIFHEPALCGQTTYPTWLSQELCAMLGQERETLYHSFLWSPMGTTDPDRATSSLLFWLEQKQER